MVAALIQLLTGASARWKGIDPFGTDELPHQRIYFANHGSNLDAPVIWASLPSGLRRRTRPVAARDYWDAKSWRRYLSQKVFHAVLVDRVKGGAHQHPLAAVEKALDDGDSIILFPEGTRTIDDEGAMNHFKPGLWHLARKHPDVEMVPVYLENLNRILPKGDYLLVPLLAAVTFGPVLDRIADEEKPAFLNRARSAVEALARARGESIDSQTPQPGSEVNA